MLKGANSDRLFICVLFSAALFLCGCTSSKEKDAAAAMLAQAGESLNQGRYEEALAIIDSLPVMYPSQTALRREAMAFRPVIIEQATMREIEQCDSLIELARNRYSVAKEKMSRVDNPELVEGYWVASTGNKRNLMEMTGIQARVSEAGEFYIVSEVTGAGNLHHNSITLSLPTDEKAMSGMVPYDGELNYRINGSETVTFSWENVDSVGRFAAAHPTESMTLTFNGEDGSSKKIKLTPTEVSAIASAYEMANAQREGKMLMASRQLLERKLALARDQQKRTSGSTE